MRRATTKELMERIDHDAKLMATIIQQRDEARNEAAKLHTKTVALLIANDKLKQALHRHVTDNLWNAYYVGIELDGRWMDGGRSEGCWLTEQLSLPDGWNDAAMVKSFIPSAAERIIASATRDPVHNASQTD